MGEDSKTPAEKAREDMDVLREVFEEIDDSYKKESKSWLTKVKERVTSNPFLAPGAIAAIVTAGFFGKAFGSAMSSGNETAATGPRHSRILTMLTGRCIGQFFVVLCVIGGTQLYTYQTKKTQMAAQLTKVIEMNPDDNVK